MDNISALHVFVRAADARSFTAAGQQLGISASAVSKAIVRLEERLGVRLFHRSTRTINPDAGRRVVPGALPPHPARNGGRRGGAAADPQRAARQAAHQPAVGGHALHAQAGEFKRSHPGIELDIDYSDRLVDVIEEGFDAVIRSGEPGDSRLTARRLGACRKVIVGAPAYFGGGGLAARAPGPDARHACLLYRFPSTGKLDVWPLAARRTSRRWNCPPAW